MTSVVAGAVATPPLGGDGPFSTAFVTNINVIGGRFVDGVWWIPQGAEFEITANAGLPDLEMIVIFERILDATSVIDDARAIAKISAGNLSIKCKFPHSGNYTITQERLNRGLSRKNALIRFSFPALEFDSYIAVGV